MSEPDYGYIDLESCFEPIFEPPLETLEEWQSWEDEPEPTKFLPVNVGAPSSMDVYGSISLSFEEPIASFDTAAIHLRQKVDTLWKDIPFDFEQDSVNLIQYAARNAG